MKYINGNKLLSLAIVVMVQSCSNGKDPIGESKHSISEQSVVSDVPQSNDEFNSRLANPDAKPLRGVLLSFDDTFIDSWFEARTLFLQYNARVTFFICRYHTLTPEQKFKLSVLEKDGHEIAYHSTNHTNPREYLKSHSVDQYVAEEILPDLKLMNKDGYFPENFAYPWGGDTPELSEKLLSMFGYLRTSGRLKGTQHIHDSLSTNRNLRGASLDSGRFVQEGFDDTLKLLNEDDSNVGVLYTHNIVENSSPRSFIQTAVLEKVLSDFSDNGTPFLTFSDLKSAHEPGKENIYSFLNEGSQSKANLILKDIWPVDRFENVPMPGGPTWSEDPYKEKYWRFLFYSLRPTSSLIYAYNLTKDERYVRKLVSILESFLANGGLESEAAKDPHTSSFLQMVLINSFWKLEGWGKLTLSLKNQLNRAILNRAEFLADPRNFEHGYNHAITQAAALLLTAVNFPHFADASTWKALAIERLDGVLKDTVASDGVQVEQSPFYHFYELKFLFEINLWAEKYKGFSDPLLSSSYQSMLKFAKAIVGPNGFLPNISSSTQFDIRRADLMTELAESDKEFQYLYSEGEKGDAPLQRNILFPESGFAIFRSAYQPGADFSKAGHLVFDVGPYRTNHSQLDALNLTFYSQRPMLVDSGLFTYEKGKDKNYYSGTSAHNTIVVDGKDQVRGTVTQHSFVDGGEWGYQSAEHSLYAGVIHKRGVLFLEKNLSVVFDKIASTQGKTHRFEAMWHFAPDLEVSRRRNGAIASGTAGTPIFKVTPLVMDGLRSKLVRGETSPKQGWVSEQYEKEKPAWVLAQSQKATQATFVNVLSANESLLGQTVQVKSYVEENNGFSVTLEGGGKKYEFSITDFASPAEKINFK